MTQEAPQLSPNLTEFSLVIRSVGINKQTGERFWKATTSDILPDSYNDEMSLDLYQSFTRRIEQGEAPPEQYCSEAWAGGMPYVSVAHYREHSIAGDTQRVYVDGTMLKANGTFRDTKLGKACFEALLDDLYAPTKRGTHDPVRVSIAFLDYKHQHKASGYIFERSSLEDVCPECVAEKRARRQSGRVFLDGLLIHFAMTRVPVNKRTLMEVEKSMTTRLEDAASIVGEELAEEMDAKEQITRSEAVIVKSEETERSMDEEDHYMPYGGSTTFADLKSFMDANKEQERISDLWHAFRVLAQNIWMGSVEDKPGALSKLADEFKAMVKDKNAVIYESLAQLSLDSDPVPPVPDKIAALAEQVARVDEHVTSLLTKLEALSTPAPAPVDPAHPLQAQLAQLRSDYDSLLLLDATPEEKLASIQAAYSELGEAIRRSFTVAEPPAQAKAEDMLVALLSKMNDKLDLLAAQQTRSAAVPSTIPAPRSVPPASVPQQGAPVQRSDGTTPSKLRAMIDKSVGL